METEIQNNTSATEAIVPPMGMGAALAPMDSEDEMETGDVQTAAPAESESNQGKDTAVKKESAPAGASAKDEKANPQVAGVLKGIQAERARRQFAENRLKEVEQELMQYKGEPPAPTAQVMVDPSIERKLLTISENTARSTHPDYEEKFAIFSAEAEKNPELYNTVMSSDHPGEAAYIAGKNLMLQQKYGADPEKMIEKVREETREELKAQLRAEIEAENKDKVLTRNNQPKNILAGRTAGGTQQETVPVVGFSQLLARRPKR